MNRRAELLLGGDFHLSAGRLVAVDLPSNSALQRFVARGVSARRGETFVSGPIVIHCKGEARYLVEAVPMTALLTAVFSAARILLLVTPLKAPTPPSETVLRQALGLTPAEARLARALASGHDMEESAKLLGIRMTTARTQLRAIFGKSNTRRQAELVRLLTRFSGEFEAEQ
jgi:DNA-binding CsgD family transcriptional regulator